MRHAVGAVLPFAVVVAVSPINIVAAILLLFSSKPLVNAASYLAGFMVGVAAVLGVVTALAGAIDLSPGSDPMRGASALLLGLGVCLVAQAARTFRSRPGPGEEPDLPKWMDGIADLSAGKASVLGLTIGALNPKNIAVGLAAAVAIASAELPGGQQVAVIAIYVVIASLGVAAPIVAMLVLGERSRGVLDGWKSWLDRNNAGMMAVVYVLFGAILIGKGIAGI